MKELWKSILYILIIAYIVFSQLVIPVPLLKYYDLIINPLAWLIFFLLSLFLSKDSSKRYKGKREYIKLIIIIMLIYSIFYFALGLIFTYQYSPYNRSFLGIIRNLYVYIPIIIFEEYVRNSYITPNNTSKMDYIFIMVLFILLDIDFRNLGMYFINAESTFKFIFSVLLLSIIKNLLLNYIVNKSSYISTSIVRIFLVILPLLLPFLPNLGWFLESILIMILCLVIYNIYLYIQKKESRDSKREYKKSNPILLLPFLIVFIGLLGFILQWFKYYPVAVMSNSMYDAIKRGDAVIVEKLNKDDLDTLEIGDVICYQLDNALVVHRIIKIQKQNGELIFTTKGDNNNAPDALKVFEAQVRGRVKLKIVYAGYPSVWLNDIISKKPDVET